MRGTVRTRRWLGGACLALLVLGWGIDRPAAAEPRPAGRRFATANPFGLVLELKQSDPLALGEDQTTAPPTLEMPDALAPVREAAPGAGLDPRLTPWEPEGGRSLPVRRPIVRGEELRWFLLGGTLIALIDRQLLRPFDPDIHEPASQRNPMAARVSAMGTGLPLLVALGTPYVLDGGYGRKSTRLAVAALLDATMITESLKFLTGKERPFQSDGGIRFHGPGSGFSSFPSGHTSASFAVATVLGSRYPRYRTLLLGLAAAVGVSRMSTASHFPSDVFVGAGIGIYTGRRALATNGRVLGLGIRF
jgi:membrane-associated phospholipid phosphatase